MILDRFRVHCFCARLKDASELGRIFLGSRVDNFYRFYYSVRFDEYLFICEKIFVYM